MIPDKWVPPGMTKAQVYNELAKTGERLRDAGVDASAAARALLGCAVCEDCGSTDTIEATVTVSGLTECRCSYCGASRRFDPRRPITMKGHRPTKGW